MADHKLEAAKAAFKFIKTGETIGLGAGTTVLHLANMIGQDEDLARSVVLVSSSFKTNTYLQEQGLNVKPASATKHLDIYFDGCDQFDQQLNALKSGGGIHTTEKILASMATEFILMGDDTKFVPQLNATYPLVIEILPQALQIVLDRLRLVYPDADIKLRMCDQKDGAVISDNGNLLADIRFTAPPQWQQLNIDVKMIPGIVEHSLFYGMATKVIIAGESGIRIITPIR
ncbi:ribose-5-phosphate isomerase [Mucilaginibacter sp. OK268]|jgi:ribose 5-phosphate isomerase A|uniref:ribose 5-phosphate isomerase A n=1 Tax=Mucilaginibacter sp. OK268 TaxID=1881048 RepID=UPI0008836A39|nr:ribose 5-phosphate isomerase A [Mucilaginibacter sp. OK268]SDP51915.1 ribose-5-phosphate isomerase [Mucilaginibacter sp. OK268]